MPGDLLDNGYVLPPDLSYDEWAGILKLADHIVEASPWWLCDIMSYGERRFGEQHSQALPTADTDPDGASQARIKQASWMASVWPRGTRVPGQSYTAHRVVAKLDHDDAVALLTERGEDGKRLPTRDLVRRAIEIERAIPSSTSAPVCAADAPWEPCLDDLEVGPRRDLESAASAGTVAAHCEDAFILGALWLARYAGNEGLFRADRWRD